jgi:NAD(P)-dependent dehydrogenase (short-subunit alcohol dehydrogenase family)
VRLQGKVSLVTGAGGGIGRGIALVLAQEGSDLALNCLRSREAAGAVAEEAQRLGRRAEVFPADISIKAEAERLVDEVLASFGRIDVLVNNAGAAPYCHFLELSEESWDRTLAVDLKAPFLLSQRVAREMLRLRVPGRIISISSVGAAAAQPGLAHYDAAKAGLEGLTRAMAVELGPHSITVNAVAPGAVEVPRNRRSLTQGSYPEAWRRLIPIGRWGQPEEIGRIVAFLASPEASYLNGQVIRADGGQTARAPQPDYDFDQHEPGPHS